ncbi:MAG: methyltransferase domain-containing protein, partial [Burkholderiales bacterium]
FGSEATGATSTTPNRANVVPTLDLKSLIYYDSHPRTVEVGLAAIRASTGTSELVETGTGTGDSLAWARAAGFLRCRSVELHESLLAHCRKRFAGDPAVSVVGGNSKDFLAGLATGPNPCLYYLDAHFAGGADFGLVDYEISGKRPESFPLLAELDELLPKLTPMDVVVIDDARLYFEGAFQNGECPAFARRWHEKDSLLRRLQSVASTHQHAIIRQDEGYMILFSNRFSADDLQWLNILPHDSSGPVSLIGGVPGVTAISIQRRLADSRFANRYFVGAGLDVGGGQDSLALYRELFPNIRNVFVYDVGHGDAQLLANVPNDCFDFLYSSHCLEHVRDPREALANWIRVVKPSGHLVINIPDEDLYEQGVWPSRFNTDHKVTFTLLKRRSWSPVSINVIELVAEFSDRVAPLSVQLIDHGYRYGLQGQSVDQTRTPLAEAAIEIVLRKLPR